jgi:hypothetical protein
VLKNSFVGMKKYLLTTVLCGVCIQFVAGQNVGIGETAPVSRLTVKGNGSGSPFMIKNGDNDSLVYTTFRNLHLGGYHTSNSGVVNISNKYYLPSDPFQLQLTAAGEKSGGNVEGSLSMMRFSNINSDKYFYLSSYTGADLTAHNFYLSYLDPGAGVSQTLLYLKPNGQTGLGTYTPTGRLQINHLSGVSSPTLNLYDSTANGTSIVQFINSGGSNYWQIRGTVNNTLSTSTTLNFATQAGVQMTLRGNGNLGVGVTAPSEKLDVDGNIRTTGEINRTSTGTANLVPICYGNVSSAGLIHSGSGNFTVSRITTGWYAITITGESYQFQVYTTVVTPVTGPAMVATGSGGGNLYVYTYDQTGAAADNQFCFTVYQQ